MGLVKLAYKFNMHVVWAALTTQMYVYFLLDRRIFFLFALDPHYGPVPMMLDVGVALLPVL